jgi:hypothetical protein
MNNPPSQAELVRLWARAHEFDEDRAMESLSTCAAVIRASLQRLGMASSRERLAAAQSIQSISCSCQACDLAKTAVAYAMSIIALTHAQVLGIDLTVVGMGFYELRGRKEAQ